MASKSSPTIEPPPSISGARVRAEVAQRDGADVERGLRALHRRRQEAPAERVRGRERDRVQGAVDAAPARRQVVGQRLEVLGALDVELEHVGRRGQRLRGALGQPARRGRTRSGRPRRPARCAASAAWKAIESRVSAPVMRIRLPSSITAARRSGRPSRSARASPSAVTTSRAPQHLDRHAGDGPPAAPVTLSATATRPAASSTGCDLGDLAGHADRVAELDGPLEDHVAHAPQREHALGVERAPARPRRTGPAARGRSARRTATRPPTRRRCAAGGSRRSGAAKADDVGFGDRAPARGEAVARLQRVERPREEALGS